MDAKSKEVMSNEVNEMLLERWFIEFLEQGYTKEEAVKLAMEKFESYA